MACQRLAHLEGKFVKEESADVEEKLSALIARAERENPKALADAFRRAVLVRRGLTLTRTSKGPVLSLKE